MRSGCGVSPGTEAGATFASTGEVTGWAVGKGAIDAVVAGGVEAAGLVAGAVWLAGVGSGRDGVVAAGFGCPKAEVSAAKSSATEQRGRSTRYV